MAEGLLFAPPALWTADDEDDRLERLEARRAELQAKAEEGTRTRSVNITTAGLACYGALLAGAAAANTLQLHLAVAWLLATPTRFLILTLLFPFFVCCRRGAGGGGAGAAGEAAAVVRDADPGRATPHPASPVRPPSPSPSLSPLPVVYCLPFCRLDNVPTASFTHTCPVLTLTVSRLKRAGCNRRRGRCQGGAQACRGEPHRPAPADPHRRLPQLEAGTI